MKKNKLNEDSSESTQLSELSLLSQENINNIENILEEYKKMTSEEELLNEKPSNKPNKRNKKVK
jgi:hypothetical protein